jgi:hypothetical protein
MLLVLAENNSKNGAAGGIINWYAAIQPFYEGM